MKSILTFIAVSIIVLSVVTGCRKYDYISSMGATIDTISFTATGQASVTAIVDTTTHNPQLVTILGQTTIFTPGTSFQPSIKLIVPNVTGTYVIDTSDKTRSAYVYTSATGYSGSVAISGQINILSINNGRIQGNFILTCADGTTITGGQYIATESFL